MMVTKYKQKKELPALVAVSKRAGRAIKDFDMIAEGDRIAVAVSGGKDSLSLLHVMRDRQRISPVDFEFVAVHVDFDFEDFNPQPQGLIDYLQQQEFAYRVEKVNFLEGEKYEKIDCYRFSAARRKALFRFCEREHFNKIAFGHHMDDIAETILLNQFYRGEIGAMKPKQELFGGRITIIRPLAYVREESMEFLARHLGIASMSQSKCADDDTSHRMIIKQMLREMEKHNPQIVKNIFKSLQNIKTDYLIEA